MKSSILLLTGVAVLASLDSSFAAPPNQAGQLDHQFGHGGLARTHADRRSEDIPQEIVQQSNGSLVVFGSTLNPETGALRVEISRFRANGDVDHNFGGFGGDPDGVVVLRSLYFGATGRDIGYSGLVQPDGKILVTGSAQSADGTQSKIFVVRLHSNGCLDYSFGNQGVVITTVGAIANSAAKIMRQPDGKFIVAGFTITGLPGSSGPSDYDFALVRYNSNGTLDSSFGTGGKVVTSMGNGQDLARTAELLPDGRIMVGGQSAIAGGWAISLAKFLANGQLDISFGFGGRLFMALAGFDSIWDIAVQPDGKFIIAAQACNTSVTTCDGAIARMYPSGSLDSSFSPSTYGIVITQFNSGARMAENHSVKLQADGKIVTAGFDRLTKNAHFARYLTNGSLDPSFGTGGKAIISNKLDTVADMIIQSDGDISAAGQAPYGMTHGYGFGVIRLEP